ncbi:MAG: hypothetical protein R3C53_13775 [Pirellulaceae bacterium]
MKRLGFAELAKFAVVGYTFSIAQTCSPWAFCQERTVSESGHTAQPAPSAAREAAMFLPFAQFQIPFNVDASGPEPAMVQLWVSTDEGASWQLHGSAKPETKHFDFRAASEGLYLFSVHTIDATGASFPSESPPLRVQIDTTKPKAAIRADVNGEGKIVVDMRVIDSFLEPQTAALRIRTDRDADWKEVAVESLAPAGELFEGQAVVPVGPCREVAIVFVVKDQANNVGEATFKLTMPRTAAGEQDMKLASTGVQGNQSNSFVPSSKLVPIAGATPWEPNPAGNYPTKKYEGTAANSPRSPGRLVGDSGLSLELSGSAEELPLPAAEIPTSVTGTQDSDMLAPGVQRMEKTETANPESHSSGSESPESDPERSAVGQAYHCSSRAFSLDYSVEALGGTALADVELWGTEDGGRTWNMWGSDPDRQTPFDVQVGNDGLFGFRMVIVGANGVVSNRPKDGDSSDVWINIDTETPTAKITRAVYGEGPEDGLLVIDYTCNDSHLVDRPITLSFSERLDGPWTTIATGLKDTGIYLWKADPNLPDRIYLKLEVVDKAGNIGAHRLDLPIDIRGLAPRGRIQGFRPITLPQK